MTDKKHPLTPELQALLSELIDGKLSDESAQKLCDILRENPNAQDEYENFMALHALLHLDFSDGQLQLLPPVVQSAAALTPIQDNILVERASKYRLTNLARIWDNRSWRLIGAFATLAASVSFICWWYGLPISNFAPTDSASIASSDSRSEGMRDDPARSDYRAVAVISQASRASWSDPTLPLNNGASLTPGRFKLEKGLIQIEFVSGVSAVIEAPAQFELVSPNRVICNLGKIRAHMPSQAIGFTITTPTYSAVDLGTEFTVQVERSGETQFQVIEGKVDLRGDRNAQSVVAQQLTTGQSVRSTPAGRLSPTVAPQSDFVGTEQMLEMATAALRERYDDWNRFSHQIRSAPNVILYYGFDGHEPWERILHNDGSNTNKMLNGAIVGCQWTTGRWNGKQALEFKRTTDRVRVNVPGEFESLTYAAWLRVEGLERWLNSLMLTDGHQPGEVHWQITDQGQLMLGVKAEPNKSHDFYSPSLIGPKDLGRWVHLACVYNGKDGYVSHFLDGAEVSRENIRIPTKLRIGPAEIGNWVPQDLREYRIRSLNGRIDEFILFNTPLTTEQIRSIYEAGKPQSSTSATKTPG
jgi:hypothetical protein